MEPSLDALAFLIGGLGIVLYVVPIYVAGFTQSSMWHELDDLGRLKYPLFLDTLQSILPYWWLRIIGGGLFFIGMVMLAINALMTWLSRPATYHDPVLTAPPLTPLPADYRDLPPRPNRFEGKPVLEAAAKIDRFAMLDWHRRWERLPFRFAAVVTLVIVVASLAELLPVFLVRANVPTLASVKPYTPLELAGRDIYLSEGCHNCHSQMVRAIVSETQRFGDFSKAGESIYDHPFQWGSRRIGPDLAREGGKQSSFWHWTHFQNPSQSSPGSVMPSYEYLLAEKLNFDEIQRRVTPVVDWEFPIETNPGRLKRTPASNPKPLLEKSLPKVVRWRIAIT